MFAHYFDKVYVLNLITYKDRFTKIYKELLKIGCERELIDGTIQFSYGIPIPCLTDGTAESLYKLGLGCTVNSYGNFSHGALQCAIEHYRIVKEAYELGYDKILVLEDDISLINNIEEFSRCLSIMPTSYDVLHFDGCCLDPNETYNLCLDKTPQDAKWIPLSNLHLWGTTFMAFSRSGMEEYLKSQEAYFRQADYYTFLKGQNCYYYSYPMAIAQDMVSTIGTITNSEYNSLNLFYKYVDKSLFE